MLLLQTYVLGGNKWNCFKTMLDGNKLNCFKATQVLGGPTCIPDKLRGTWSFGIKGGPKSLGQAFESKWCHVYIYIYIYIHRHVFRPSQNSSVWLGLTSREQLMSPECSKHHVLSFAKILVVNKTKNILFSSVLSREINE